MRSRPSFSSCRQFPETVKPDGARRMGGTVFVGLGFGFGRERGAVGGAGERERERQEGTSGELGKHQAIWGGHDQAALAFAILI